VETEAFSRGVIVGIVRERAGRVALGHSRHLGGVQEREQQERELIEIRTKV
jgi:hypothetical protein